MAKPAHLRSQESLEGKYAGRHVGRYRLITEIAAGGMASVYLALDTEADSALSAVKVIHERLATDEQLVRMFFDEACLASQICHRNTARVLTYGSEGSLHYLAMEYLLGETWQQVLAQAARTQRTGVRVRLPLLLAQVLREVALGLHAAHEAVDAAGRPLGVVHRDVSPQNVMVGYDGQVRVLDFGIAKASSRMDESERGQVQGRFAYMAPEQMRGLPVDRRADLWSLGVLLWEGLTCRRLFRRSSDAETIMATAYGDIPRADEINPAAPAALADIAQCLLLRDRELRPATARQVANKLEAYLTEARAPLDAESLARQMRRLFGTRGDEKRAVIERLRRRFSRPIDVGVLLPDPTTAEDTARTAPRAPKASGVRARKPRSDRPARPSFSEFPTLPRMKALDHGTHDGRGRRYAWLLGAAIAAAATVYLWLS